ncbi:uncharacterized protein LOC114255304 [Monomorium pharaonis]|uniref:uncharacterized protein LOC114255304 n=1 Tax=Monomorium pharaonis TaxID=307658 RepID=UPI001746D0E2|nr:uncharacterized protein LOC114255304 [Monomorium pharaonis]
MDHQYNYTYNNEEILINEETVTDINENATNACVQEKIEDDYLIELYREERRFLYDKRNRDFKDNELKNNAWEEISLIMTKDKNLGNHYTAEYCKKRMTTLREQYAKLKKEQDLKSGSAASTKKKSSLLSQLSFLNEYIQKRRTVTNIKQYKNIQISDAISRNKNATSQKTEVINNDNLNKTEIEKSLSNQDNAKYESEEPIKKSRKMNKSFAIKNENDVLQDLTNAAMNICIELQMNSTSDQNIVSKSADHAFAEFITLSLQGMAEPERSRRRNKIFQDLIIPLDENCNLFFTYLCSIFSKVFIE